MKMFESYPVIFTGPFMDPQTVGISFMRDNNSIFGHLHDCRGICALSTVTHAICKDAITEEFRPETEFYKELIIYNGEFYKQDAGLLNIKPNGDILIYCDRDQKVGFEVEGKVGWKDVTFGYQI